MNIDIIWEPCLKAKAGLQLKDSNLVESNQTGVGRMARMGVGDPGHVCSLLLWLQTGSGCRANHGGLCHGEIMPTIPLTKEP